MLKITLDFSHEELSSDKINQICHEIKEKIEGLLNEDESEADEEKIIELTEDEGELKVVSSREGSLSPQYLLNHLIPHLHCWQVKVTIVAEVALLISWIN